MIYENDMCKGVLQLLVGTRNDDRLQVTAGLENFMNNCAAIVGPEAWCPDDADSDKDCQTDFRVKREWWDRLGGKPPAHPDKIKIRDELQKLCQTSHYSRGAKRKFCDDIDEALDGFVEWFTIPEGKWLDWIDTKQERIEQERRFPATPP